MFIAFTCCPTGGPGGRGSDGLVAVSDRTRPLFSRAGRPVVGEAAADPTRRLLLAFDVDGTLAPIVSRPESASVADGTLKLLTRAARLPRVRVVVVSARPLRDLRRLVPDARVRKIAQYGLEGPLAPTAATRRRIRKAVRVITERLRPVVQPFRGAWIEPKGLSVAVHHRALSVGRRTALRHRLRDEERAARALGFGTQLGDRVNDFVPLGYDKGRALNALRTQFRPGSTIFFGDSAGDEPAFAALAPTDISVRVGLGPTAARYHVRGPHDVARFLRALVAERTQGPSSRRR